MEGSREMTAADLTYSSTMHAVIMAVLDLRIYLLVVPLALGPWAGRLPAGGCASGTISLGITSQLAEGVVVAHDILGRAE